MKVYIDTEVEVCFDFDYVKVAEAVCEKVLLQEECPFECEVNISITDNDSIRRINRESRNIDKETDVLSFPGLFFDSPADFDEHAKELADNIDPENGLVVLGDIVLSVDRIYEQAKEYGHSVKREYAFLITHSMLHLCGYDHMEEDEAILMEEHQRMVLDALDITRGD